jgi:hypothetical protein
VIRNTASGQGANNFVITGSGNSFGTIIDVSAGGAISSTSPWANFSY